MVYIINHRFISRMVIPIDATDLTSINEQYPNHSSLKFFLFFFKWTLYKSVKDVAHILFLGIKTDIYIIISFSLFQSF